MKEELLDLLVFQKYKIILDIRFIGVFEYDELGWNFIFFINQWVIANYR